MIEFKIITFKGVAVEIYYDWEDRSHDPNEVAWDVYIIEMYIGGVNVTELLESRNKEIEEILSESFS